MYNFTKMLENNICKSNDLINEFKKQAKELGILINQTNFEDFNKQYLLAGGELQF